MKGGTWKHVFQNIVTHHDANMSTSVCSHRWVVEEEFQEVAGGGGSSAGDNEAASDSGLESGSGGGAAGSSGHGTFSITSTPSTGSTFKMMWRKMMRRMV